MAKTVVTLTDPLSSLVTKVNQISNDLGDIQNVHFYDSSVAGMLITTKASADSTNEVVVRSKLSTGTPKNLAYDSSNGQFNALFDSAQARQLISVSASGTGSLAYNNSTGVLTYVGAATDLVADTTPQLGGNLDVNTKNINFGDAASPGTDDTLQFGASADLKLYHDGSNSYVQDSGSTLILKGGAIRMHSSAGDNMLSASTGGTIKFYFNGTKKIETTAVGVTVDGKTTTTTLNIGGTDITASGTDINKLLLGTGQQLGIFKVATSAPSSASDFTGNTKLIMVY